MKYLFALVISFIIASCYAAKLGYWFLSFCFGLAAFAIAYDKMEGK